MLPKHATFPAQGHAESSVYLGGVGRRMGGGHTVVVAVADLNEVVSGLADSVKRYTHITR